MRILTPRSQNTALSVSRVNDDFGGQIVNSTEKLDNSTSAAVKQFGVVVPLAPPQLQSSLVFLSFFHVKLFSASNINRTVCMISRNFSLTQV